MVCLESEMKDVLVESARMSEYFVEHDGVVVLNSDGSVFSS